MKGQDNIERHIKEREQLIAKDRQWRQDTQPKHIAALGPRDVLEKADAIIRKIRKHEEDTIWHEANETEQIPHIFPGMEFLTAKGLIESTKIFKLMQKMPKGALLHVHMDATCDAEFLYRTAIQEPQLHIKVPHVLSVSNMRATLPEFMAKPPNFKPESEVGLTDSAYAPESWISAQRARALWPESMGGPTGFDAWVIASMRLNPQEAYVEYNTSKKIWKKFLTTFVVARGLLGFEPIMRKYFRELLLGLINDGVSYVELRFNFFPKVIVRANGEHNFTNRESLAMLDEVINEIRAEMEAQGRSDEFVGAKVIYITIRFVTPEELQWWLDDCIQLKKEFPHLIAGFDLVGQEDTGYPLLHYLPKLLEFQERCKEEGLSIPFIFHAGETLGDGDKVDENLYDALLLGTRRIGHGFSIVKHPHLMELCRERRIAVEVCPVSNEVLRLTSSMPTHPLPIMLNNGVPVALSSDDPSVFTNMGLAYDYFQVLVSSEITGLITLGILARESLLISELEEDRKVEAVAKWDRRWQLFLQEVISYGENMQ